MTPIHQLGGRCQEPLIENAHGHFAGPDSRTLRTAVTPGTGARRLRDPELGTGARPGRVTAAISSRESIPGGWGEEETLG